MATKPRSLTKQTRPSVVLMPTFLQSMATKPGHRPFRVLMPIFLQSMATKPGHRPFRVLMPIFLNSVATKPRLLTLRGSHAELSQLSLATKPRPTTLRGSHARLSLSSTVISRHDARLSSTTHCALRASRIIYNLTNLSRCYPFLLSIWTYAAPCHTAHFPPNSFQCSLVILQALSLTLCQNHQAS